MAGPGHVFEMPEPGLARPLRRRDRKRRNRQITPGVVGMAVFVAAIWIVNTVGSFDRARTPGTSGPDPAPPTVSDLTPNDDAPRPDQVGFVGLAPEGATPSAPERGELVVSLWGRSTTDGGPLFRAWVYADGRIIWDKEGDFPYGANSITTGFLEQHLTPEGVELLRSEIVSTGLFNHDLELRSGHVREKVAGQKEPVGVIWGIAQAREGDRLVTVSWSNPDMYPQDFGTPATPEQANALERLDGLLMHPESWLPASAWEDEEIKAYVPSTLAVCYSGDQRSLEASVILPLLPPSAEDLLRGRDRTRYDVGPSDFIYCSDVTPEKARALAETLDAAGLALDDRSIANRLGYVLEAPSFLHTDISIYFEPYLPHHEFLLCSPCR